MSKVNLGAGAPKSTWTREKEEELRKPLSKWGSIGDPRIRKKDKLRRERAAATEIYEIVHMAEGKPIRYRGGIELRGGGMVKKRK
jgi:hypothetical protein